MRFLYKSVCFGLVLYAVISGCSGNLSRVRIRIIAQSKRVGFNLRAQSGQVIIRGNEEPLTIGLSRDLNCTWRGGGNVSTMEWFVVGLEAMAIETATEVTSVILTLTPDDDGLDGAMLMCKVTLSNGQETEETVTLTVQGKSLA